MNISIHATHRLPFFNATVTAKQLSSSTTPVAFKLATGKEIGFKIKTNARGFICRTDGTPYNDGVFVCRSEFESPEVDGEILVRYDREKMKSEPEEMVGQFMNVRIIQAGDYDLLGECI